MSVDINGRDYEWCPHSFGPGVEQLVGVQSHYAVGFIFPPAEEAKNPKVAWSAEHVPSDTRSSGFEDTKDEAKATLVRWLKTRGASCKKS